MGLAFLDLGDKIEINLKLISPNTVLATPTYDAKGQIVLPAYTPFTQDEINSCLNKGIEKVYYSKSDRDSQPIHAKNLKEYLSKNVYRGPRQISIETQRKAMAVTEKIEETVKNKGKIEFMGETKEVVDSIFTDLKYGKGDIINLLDIQSFDDFTYSHSLNVGVVAMKFAKKIGMSSNDVKDIGVASFLHDIGKIRIPYDLLHKPGILTTEEFSIIQKHSRYGYEIIKDCEDISERIKKSILLHHERYDGTGYPFGFRDSNIDDYAYIVNLADYFDALTTELSYKKAFSIQETLNLVIKQSGKMFKPDMAHQFAKEIPNLFKESRYYIVGSYVMLNTKEVAKIVAKESDLTSKPEVEIISNSHGKQLAKPLHIDLRRDSTRHIDRIIKYGNN